MIEHKYFESQQPDESIILLTRRHILALFPAILIALIIYVIGFAAILGFPLFMPGFVSGFGYNVFVLVLSLLFLFNTVFLFSAWILHYLHVVLLTTEHIVEIDQMGIFSRKVSELALDKIQDVTASQSGIINTMFNLGTVTVETAGEAPNFILQLLPDPNKISQTIMESEDHFCTRHGIRKDSVDASRVEAVSPEVPVRPPLPEGAPFAWPQTANEDDNQANPEPLPYEVKAEGLKPEERTESNEPNQNDVQ